jgi:hypothetical protein
MRNVSLFVIPGLPRTGYGAAPYSIRGESLPTGRQECFYRFQLELTPYLSIRPDHGIRGTNDALCCDQ